MRTLTLLCAVLFLMLPLLSGCGGGGGNGSVSDSHSTAAIELTAIATNPVTATGPPTIVEAGGFRLTIPFGATTDNASLTATISTTPDHGPLNADVTLCGSALILSGNCNFSDTELQLETPDEANATILVATNSSGDSWMLAKASDTSDRLARSTSSIYSFSGQTLNPTSGPVTIALYHYLPQRNVCKLIIVSGANNIANPQAGQRFHILIHGINADGSSMLPLAQAISGYDGVMIFQYDFTLAPDVTALALLSLLKRAESPLANCSISLQITAHSYGGLIARWFAERLANSTSLSCNHVVTLSTPHLGAPITENFLTSTALNLVAGRGWLWSASDPAIHWMSPGNGSLANLNQTLGNVRLSCIGSSRYPRSITSTTDTLDHWLCLANAALYGSQPNDGVVSKASAEPTIATNSLAVPPSYSDQSECNHMTIIDPAKISEYLNHELAWPFGQSPRRATSTRINGSWQAVSNHCYVSPKASSVDGHSLVFVTNTDDIGFKLNGKQNVFLFDLKTGLTTLVSHDLNGRPANDDCDWESAAISANGRYIIYASKASNLVDNDTNGVADVFVYDCQTDKTERVSISSLGAQANAESGSDDLGISISNDGSIIAFSSYASNLVANDTNDTADVFVRNRKLGTTVRISLTNTGEQLTSISYSPSLCGDGTRGLFVSQASNLPGNTVVIGYSVYFSINVYSWNSTTGQIKLVSQGVTYSADYGCYHPVISNDGNFAAFESLADSLITGDTNNATDIYLSNLTTGALERVSLDQSGKQFALASNSPTISHDGRFVAFSAITNSNQASSVFVWDSKSRKTSNASGANIGGQSQNPAISLDGRSIFFMSNTRGLVSTGNSYNGAGNVYYIGNPCLP